VHLLGKILTTGGRLTTGPLIVMHFGIGSPSLAVSLDKICASASLARHLTTSTASPTPLECQKMCRVCFSLGP